MTAVLIDDEQNNLDNLSRLLDTYCPDVTVLGTALNADEGRNIIVQYHPDLVFLDIQMPGKNGFDLLQSLTRHDFAVIFVTAHDQYGIQAVKFSAVDYLLKPVHIDELRAAVQKASIKSDQQQQNAKLQNLIHLLHQQQHREEHRIALTTLKEMRFVETRHIIRVESTNNYSQFYLDGAEKLTVSKPIHEYEELLKDYGFVRCHQSHLINKKRVRSWMKDEGSYLLLDNGEQIPVARNRKQAVAEALL